MKPSENQRQQDLIWLKQMYVFGKDLTVESWRKQTDDPDRHELFQGLVWQNGRRRYMLTGDGLQSLQGEESPDREPITLAHPVEMDAREILLWEQFLKEHRIRTPFPQLEEPVVLENGRLTGSCRAVESGGKTYEMSERYRGFRLPLSMYISLQREGFHFIVRQKWQNHYCLDEIELVNIMTPAGIFYDCRPSCKMEKLQARKDRFLEMGLFFPFRNVRMRTLNHVAAVLESNLLDQFMTKDRPDLLLPHVRSLTGSKMKGLISQAPDTKCAAFLTEYGTERGLLKC